MSQPVVIKGNKHGIIVVLDAEAEFKDLKVQIEEKFKAAGSFRHYCQRITVKYYLYYRP